MSKKYVKLYKAEVVQEDGSYYPPILIVAYNSEDAFKSYIECKKNLSITLVRLELVYDMALLVLSKEIKNESNL